MMNDKLLNFLIQKHVREDGGTAPGEEQDKEFPTFFAFETFFFTTLKKIGMTARMMKRLKVSKITEALASQVFCDFLFHNLICPILI
jgi:hypothetical protein